MQKSGWRPCPRCKRTIEYGTGCDSCRIEADSLIESAMTITSRHMWEMLKRDTHPASLSMEPPGRIRSGSAV